MMSTAKQSEFHGNIYRSAIEEAAFLYERRRILLHDPEITWKDMAEFEERFEAYMDIITMGDEQALEVCKTQALEGDPGELHVAMRVFCRQNKGDYVAETWRNLDPEDTERVDAVTDALKEDCPESWLESLIPVFSRNYAHLMPVVATIFGYNRFQNAEVAMVKALDSAPDWVLPKLIWALGRLGGRPSHTRILGLLDHPDRKVQNAAAECLLRFGEPKAVAWCMYHGMDELAPITALGLGGGRDATGVLLKRLKAMGPDDALLIALGLLGDFSTVAPLCASLQNDTHARAAATGLFLITGAELYEEMFIPDSVDEDELFYEELKEYREEGKVATKPDGNTYGEDVCRLSRNPQAWEHWLRENRSNFTATQRYRLGMPYGPLALLHTLLSETTPYRVRALAIEELNIRHSANISIEADMPVKRQEMFLELILRWAEANNLLFQPGAWHIHDGLIS